MHRQQTWSSHHLLWQRGCLVQEAQLQLHDTQVAPARLQLLVDISTPAEVLTAVEEAASAHFKANPTEFTGNKMIIANVATDPLKYMLCVWWEYAYPGEHAGTSVMATKLTICKKHSAACLLCRH